ncbi:MAG: hypothetical protein ACLTGG_11835 [Subdoligranulum sp.]
MNRFLSQKGFHGISANTPVRWGKKKRHYTLEKLFDKSNIAGSTGGHGFLAQNGQRLRQGAQHGKGTGVIGTGIFQAGVQQGAVRRKVLALKV